MASANFSKMTGSARDGPLSALPGDGSLPGPVLDQLAAGWELDLLGEEFARRLDSQDPLANLRHEFVVPKLSGLPGVYKNLLSNSDDECVYLCGHSLGLKPRKSDEFIKTQLNAWGQFANLQHFQGELPAALCDQPGRAPTARLLGAKKEEVSLMNGLTVNLNILLIAFYKPTPQRHKILIENCPFSSDLYSVVSHIKHHNYDPESSLLVVEPRKGEDAIRPEDVLEVIRKEGDSIAVIMFSGVHYFTGQKFDLEAITAAGQERGCIVGFDLAHSIGNVKIELNKWNVDFACWCSYKYLNSSCGGLAGIFIHERHHHSDLPHLHGWWSNRNDTRFEFRQNIDLDVGPEGFRISNPPPMLACLNLASLEVFEQTSMDELVCKQFYLVGYLEVLLRQNFAKASDSPTTVYAELITPADPERRGNQMSVRFVNLPAGARSLYLELIKQGIMCDFRPPDVLRFGACPLYVTYLDIFKCVHTLKRLLRTPE